MGSWPANVTRSGLKHFQLIGATSSGAVLPPSLLRLTIYVESGWLNFEPFERCFDNVGSATIWTGDRSVREASVRAFVDEVRR
jgi:hypothetical protein